MRLAAELVRGAEAELGGTGTLGLGIPGSLSPATGLVRGANSVWLNGRPLARDLSDALGREVRAENDANCFALSEAVDGAGRGARVVFGVILGTGVGGGVVADGRVIRGRNACAGEWGHAPLPWPEADEHPGPACWCERRGCLEQWASGPALARAGASAGLEGAAPGVVAALRAGDPRAARVFGAYADRLSRALAVVVDLLDPDVIVLGGGLGELPELAAVLPALIAPRVFSDVFTTPVLNPVHGGSGGVRGAAWLWGGPPG